MARRGSSGRLRADVPARLATRRESRRGGSAGCGGLPAPLPGSAAVSGLDRWLSPMNPIERAIRWVDAAQQRHKATAFVVGVIKKYGDDNGGVLAASLAHSGFVSLFPLLVVLVTLLGLVASGDPALRHEALNAVAKQVPLIGHQLAGNVHQLRRSSVIGLVAGLLALTWETTGLAQAGLFTMAQVWNLPGPERPGYLPRLGRAVLFLGVLGLGVIVTTLLTSLGTYGHNAAAIVVLGEAVALAANIGMYFIAFRVLTPQGAPTRKLVPGAVAASTGWTVLQAVGAYLVHHFLRGGGAGSPAFMQAR